MDEARILAPMETGSTIVDDSQVSDLIMVLRKLISVILRKALHPIVYLIGGGFDSTEECIHSLPFDSMLQIPTFQITTHEQCHISDSPGKTIPDTTSDYSFLCRARFYCTFSPQILPLCRCEKR